MRIKKSDINRIYKIGICVLFGGLLIGAVLLANSVKQNKELSYSDDYVAMAELPSQLSFTYYEEDKWTDILREINNNQSPFWEKSARDSEKPLKGKLTYGKLEEILKQLSVEEYVTYEKKSAWKEVSRTRWNGIYKQILDLLDTNGEVSAKNLVFLTEKGEETDNQEEMRHLTQEGYFTVSSGMDYFGYYDTYQVYVKGQKIIGISGSYEGKVTLQNVFIHTTKDEKAEILYEHQKISLDIDGLSEQITDTICDMEWKNGKVTAIYKKEDMISGRVLSFNDSQIEISGYGTLAHTGGLKIYKTYGTVEQLDESKLVIGNLEAQFVVAEKQVCGIILKQPASVDNIRVLLLNEGSPYHTEPSFVTDTDCTVTIGGQSQTIPAGQTVTASSYLPEGSSDYVKILTNSEGGRIYFSDGTGARTSLGYRGSIEIRRYSEGYGVVNELSLEQYLYGVVPSEMPASYEREALCAQAVCARSYACIQLLKGDYAAFGANVDDSTNYQVYNKQEENPQTNLAVDDTIGEVIKYNGEIAEAYYFSTSCGHTDGIGVWNISDEQKYGYLQGAAMLTDGTEPDFSSEDSFADFIKNKEVAAYDSDTAYFRWRADLKVSEHQQEVNDVIRQRYQANAGNVQIQKLDGTAATDAELGNFGAIQQITVAERSAGGCIKQLCISYEKGSVTLYTEYNIRCVLGAAISQLTDKNENPVNMSMLPSAYCTIIPVEQGFVVYGGGYGHGIGMSQNGANGMAKAGMSYVDILMKYYQGITIENIYNAQSN